MAKASGLFQIQFDNSEHFIVVPTHDKAFYKRFIQARNRMLQMYSDSLEIRQKLKKKGDGIEIARENIRLSTEAMKIMDGVLGEGATKKFFWKIYAEEPDFLPDEYCFKEMLKRLSPVLKYISRYKIG